MESNDNIKEFTCNDCQEVTKVDWSKVRPDIDDGTSNIQIYEKGDGYAYYGECMNCGNLVEIEPPVPELVVSNTDVDKDGIYIEITDKITNRSLWINAFKDSYGDWEWDYNKYIFHLDNDNDIVDKMFQEELGAYAEEVDYVVSPAIAECEDEYNKLQENKAHISKDKLKAESLTKFQLSTVDKNGNEMLLKDVSYNNACSWLEKELAKAGSKVVDTETKGNKTIIKADNQTKFEYDEEKGTLKRLEEAEVKRNNSKKKVTESDKVDYSTFTPTNKVLSGNKGLSQKEIDEMRWSLPEYFKDMTDEQKQIWTELSLRDMVMSCLVYGEDIHTAKDINAVSKYYRQPHVNEFYDTLGKDVTEEIIKQQTDYFNRGKVIRNTYTDSEGLTYNSFEEPKEESKKVTEAEDMTAVKDDIESAVEKSDSTKQEIDQVKGSLDVLKTDEESAIDGYEEFNKETAKVVDKPLADRIAEQMKEIVDDEKEHIEKLDTIKSALGENKKTEAEVKRNNSKKRLDYKLDGFKGVNIIVVDKKNNIDTEDYMKFDSMEFGIDEYEFEDSMKDGIKDILTDIYEYTDDYYDNRFTTDEITEMAEDITQDVLQLYDDLPDELIDFENGIADLSSIKSALGESKLEEIENVDDTMQSNEFWVGDPCYVLSDDIYDNIWGKKYNYQDGLIDCGNGLSFDVHRTAYGDGCYEGSNGFMYCVDSGTIAVIPKELVVKEDGIDSGSLHKSTNGEIEYDNGVFRIEFDNEILEIDTDPSDEGDDLEESKKEELLDGNLDINIDANDIASNNNLDLGDLGALAGLMASEEQKESEDKLEEAEETSKTATQELNTDLVPIINMFQYEIFNLLEGCVGVTREKIDEMMLDFAKPVIEEEIKDVLPSATVTFKDFTHPRYYRAFSNNNDVLYFDVTYNVSEYEALKEKALQDSNFEKYLQEHYTSYDGFISFFANNIKDFEEQEDWKQFVSVLSYYLPNDWENNQEDMYSYVFDHASDYDIIVADSEIEYVTDEIKDKVSKGEMELNKDNVINYIKEMESHLDEDDVEVVINGVLEMLNLTESKKRNEKITESLSKEDIMQCYISEIMEIVYTYETSKAQEELDFKLDDLKSDKDLDKSDKEFILKVIRPAILDKDLKLDDINFDKVEEDCTQAGSIQGPTTLFGANNDKDNNE